MQKDDTLDCYAGSVNRAIDYINAHLGENLSLSVLASEGSFSPCHFHRVFKAIVGETHQKFITRVRLERAVLLMEGKRSITDIALAVGFSTPAHFSAAFKAQYGRTPKAHRAGLSPKTRKNPIVASGRTVHTQPETGGTTACTAFCTTACTVREYPALRIAYVRHFGKYDFRIGFAWKRLMAWARQKRALSAESVRISCSWDDPELTEDGKLRYDACVTVVDEAEAEGAIGVRTIPGGRYAVFTFEGETAGLSAFYDRVYGELLPSSGLQLADEMGYRVHRESREEQIGGYLRNELRIPLNAR